MSLRGYHVLLGYVFDQVEVTVCPQKQFGLEEAKLGYLGSHLPLFRAVNQILQALLRPLKVTTLRVPGAPGD